MIKTTEQTIVVSATEGEKIVRVDVELGRDGKNVELKIISEVLKESMQTQIESAKENFDKQLFESKFPLVKAGYLSLEDSFMKHFPRTRAQRILKKNLKEIIKMGMPDFRHATVEPSLDDSGKIVFTDEEEKNVPTYGHYTQSWEREVKSFMPNKNSRIGTEKQYAVLLGTLIKQMIKMDICEVSEAWRLVCDDREKMEELFAQNRAIQDWSYLIEHNKFVKVAESARYRIICTKRLPIFERSITKLPSMYNLVEEVSPAYCSWVNNAVPWIVFDR